MAVDMNKSWILISVTDKTGLEHFKKLTDSGRFGILSTGGTAKRLQELDIPMTLVEEVTQFPEMMSGRIKTLHPMVFGGILADRGKTEHMEMVMKHFMPVICLVVVNLYDFKGKPDIEQIDIGGPSLLRAAAKNCASVTALWNIDDYEDIVTQLLANGEVMKDQREMLAFLAFQHTAQYDAAIAEWMRGKIQRNESFADSQSSVH
jgi:phosphoribosylaminoimidazolecarboxamide formyltransferase / IMP cyclohydrolase